ncbi:MAG: twin-arginine translocation signal domain-containing protein [Pseudomonadota bacterium]|nr:twin-arginine translocation signal domain-containing protein [Pseudomonadota bacterium]
MQRRQFLTACAAVAGASAVGAVNGEWTSATPHLYTRSRLIDQHGEPIKVAALATRTNYIFQYPFSGTPCFLLNLGRPVAGADKMLRADGAPYAWSGGVGRQRSVVAYSAICAHKLAYPTREVSFIKFQPERSPTSGANVIHCCADHSVYDPSAGARVLSGPAPQPLAAILLDYDAERDELAALGTVGAEQFDAFFSKYDFKLALEYGQGRARAPVGATTVVRELTQYCRQTVQC